MTKREHWRKTLQGNIVPICTNFNADYSCNLQRFRQHIRYIIDHGITAEYGMILVSGAAGEHPSLSFDERKALLETALEESNHRTPILFGATATHTMEAIKLTQMAQKAGAAGVQMSMPYYECPTWEDTKAFYQELNDQVDIGVMVYNTFTTGGANMYDHRLIEFLLDLPNIAGIKWHAQSGFQYDFVYQDFAPLVPFYDNEIHEVYGMMMGAVGFTSHIPVFWPEYGVKLWNLIREKKYVEALALTNRVRVPYYRLITEAWDFSSGDGIIERVACQLMGREVGPSRKPIQPCPPKIAERVRKHLIQAGALDNEGKPSNR
jgi:4-hydroxy-tetrahydrodipicolinate synthase